MIKDAGYEHLKPKVSNFLDYSDMVRDVVKSWSKKKQESIPKETIEGLRRLRDDFAEIVRKDPMTLYTPAHKVALEFHQSPAKIRYNRSANRCAKTQTAVADNYYVLTGTHPWRARPPMPAAVSVVILNFSRMMNSVYGPKYIFGETGNPLSPVFPEDGKWFHSYDARNFFLKLGCPDCAEKGKAKSCPHEKSQLEFYSTNDGEKVLQGSQKSQIHFDEQIPENFFSEAMQRLTTVPHAGLIVTETPLGGVGFWTNKVLARDAKLGVKDSAGNMMVSLHTIGQREAGLVDPKEIDANERMMTEVEARARIYGEASAFSETSVFHLQTLNDMRKEVSRPERLHLYLPSETEEGKKLTTLQACMAPIGKDVVQYRPEGESGFYVWEYPKKYHQYVIGADVAYGLTGRDASCASVLAVSRTNEDFKFRLVAQYHGWINPREYAMWLYKIGHFYNKGTIVVERRGPGEEAIRSLKEFSYINLFRDITSHAQVDFHAQSEFGMDTTAKSKPMMIASLQQTIRDGNTGLRHIDIPCDETITELSVYEQDTTEKGNVTFQASTGMHDDRVMSLALGVYATKAFPYVYNYKSESDRRRAERDLSGAGDEETDRFWAGVRKTLKEQKQKWKSSSLL